MSDRIPEVIFNMFHIGSSTMWIEDKFYIDDNLSDVLPERDTRSTVSRLPFKSSMTLSILCLEGQLNLRINQADFSLEKDDVMFAAPGAISERFDASDDLKIIVSSFSTENMEGPDYVVMEQLREWLNEGAGIRLWHADSEWTDAYVSLYRAVKLNYAMVTDAFKYYTIVGYLHMCSGILSSAVLEPDKGLFDKADRRHRDLYSRFLLDVQKYCTQERGIAFYAGRCCMSEKYFCRIIKHVSGRTPGEIIRGRVILEAKALLGEEGATVQSVSEDLHFVSVSFFCRYFKAAVGCSPGTYMRQIGAG